MSEKISFADLGLSAEILSAIEAKGFIHPSPIQAATIPTLLKDEQDIIGQAQTGTGKTAAFGLPLMDLLMPGSVHPQAIVLAPTRELAIQVGDELKSFTGSKPFNIECVYGGSDISKQIKALKSGVDIVVGTPGRVQDLIERRVLKLHEVSHVVLDEADEMLNMGFVDDVRAILSHTPDHKRVVLFSATMPKAIQNLAEEFMEQYELIKVNREKTTSLTRQIYFDVRSQDKLLALERIIDMSSPAFYGIVFCRTKRDVDSVANELMKKGYRADGLHGDLNQAAREKILGRFRDGFLHVLVATDVAARGIDVNNLTHVVNYGVPGDSETYTHRIGRTGRAGNEGLAITLVNPADRSLFNRINKEVDRVISREQLPNGDDMVEIKRQSILHQVIEEAQFAGQEMDPLVDLIKTQLSAEEAINALIKVHYGKDLDASNYANINVPERGERRERERDGDRGGKKGGKGARRGESRGKDGEVRLFVKKGQLDGMNKVDVIRMIERGSGVYGRSINGVKVLKSYSFVSVSEGDVDRIINAFKKKGHKGRPLIERAGDR